MDERIDIEVTDKVAKTIRPELLGISAAARAAHPEISKLKASLSGFNFSGMAQFRKMAADANALSVATAKLDASQTKAALSAQKLAQAEARTALAQEKVRTQAARTAEIETRSYLANERALNQAVVAENNATAAKIRTIAASQRAAQALNKEADAADRLQQEYRQQARAAAAQAGINRSFGIGNVPKSAYDSYAVFDDKGIIDKTTKSLDAMGKKAELSRNHLLNLGFQLQDIFVSLQAGQNPLTVFIQQGGQIGQIAAQSGVGMGGMAKAAGGLLLRFAPLAIAAGGIAVAFGLISREANKDEPIKNYAKTLGLTAKEMKKLEDVTVTTGDTMRAVWNVTLRNIASMIGIDTKKIASIWNTFLDNFVAYAKMAVAATYAAFVGMAYGVREIISNLNDDNADNNNPITSMMDGYKKAYDDANKYLGDIGKEQERIAKARIKAQADELKAERGPGRKGAKGFDRAKELREVIDELNQQILLSKLYGDELERQTQLEQINQTFRKNGVPLTDEERKVILDKIDTIKENGRVQDQLNRMYEEAKGPMREYNSGVSAADKLLENGTFTLERYNAELEMLERNLDDATKPMAKFARELEQQAKLVGKFGDDRAVAEYVQQLEEATLAAKQSIYKQLAANDNGEITVIANLEFTDEARANIEEFKRQLQEARQTSFVEDLTQSGLEASGQNLGGNQWIIDNAAEMYKRIDEMRQGDVESERNAAAAKRELDKRYLDARLANTEGILNQLTALESSKVREVAAIGKAAAIAEATIQGIKAVQGALATPPYWPYNAPMVIATGVAAAANVAKIAGIGFQKGGYTGDMPTNAVAGAVHGREYVMDAAATARIGVPTLEALRNGRLNPGPAANDRGAKVTVINNAGASVQVRERSDGELEILVENAMERKLGPMFERRLSNPNSRESRSVGNNYKVTRNRQ